MSDTKPDAKADDVPELRKRTQILPLALLVIIAFATPASAIANMPDRYRTSTEIRKSREHVIIEQRRDRIDELVAAGDHCQPAVARELARALVFDGRSARAYAADYEQRCGADADVRKWGNAPNPPPSVEFNGVAAIAMKKSRAR